MIMRNSLSEISEAMNGTVLRIDSAFFKVGEAIDNIKTLTESIKSTQKEIDKIISESKMEVEKLKAELRRF
jgi:exonuclease VII small subunit